MGLSLLPAPMHPQVAQHCISHGKHLVTASYVSPEMKALDEGYVPVLHSSDLGFQANEE